MRSTTLDVSEAADPTPFFASLNYCAEPCSRALPPYPGYEKVTVKIIGSASP